MINNKIPGVLLSKDNRVTISFNYLASIKDMYLKTLPSFFRGEITILACSRRNSNLNLRWAELKFYFTLDEIKICVSCNKIHRKKTEI